jgi:hypothetical protein
MDAERLRVVPLSQFKSELPQNGVAVAVGMI